jgi:ubiquinone/menaquinone biosynthesis C-methylase UbiE
MRYAIASQLVIGKSVLDLGCGYGYGTAEIATYKTARVVGVDVSQEAIQHAHKQYANSGAEYVAATCDHLSFKDRTFDSVVMFEALEHVRDAEACLSEVRRVLTRKGVCVISSPNKAITDVMYARYNSRNPYHTKELYRNELMSLLGRYFSSIKLLAQHDYDLERELEIGVSESMSKSRNLESLEKLEINDSEIDRAYNFVVICSNANSDRLFNMGALDDKLREIRIRIQSSMIQERDNLIKNHDIMIQERDGLIKKYEIEIVSLRREVAFLSSLGPTRIYFAAKKLLRTIFS